MGANKVGNAIGNVVLDKEWILLMKEAKKIGMSVEEIRLILIQLKPNT